MSIKCGQIMQVELGPNSCRSATLTSDVCTVVTARSRKLEDAYSKSAGKMGIHTFKNMAARGSAHGASAVGG